MANIAHTQPAEPIDCAVCLREIPVSEAQSSEARDYVAGFCGLACYAQWQARGDKALAPDPDKQPQPVSKPCAAT